jgi:hypothetical protein
MLNDWEESLYMTTTSNLWQFVKRAHSCRGLTCRKSSIEEPDTLRVLLVYNR